MVYVIQHETSARIFIQNIHLKLTDSIQQNKLQRLKQFFTNFNKQKEHGEIVTSKINLKNNCTIQKTDPKV